MSRLGFLLLTIALQGISRVARFCPAVDNNSSPPLAYTLSIDTTDLSGYTVSIRIDRAPRRFRLAMATHHRY